MKTAIVNGKLLTPFRCVECRTIDGKRKDISAL